ncbi:unnamed protein product, partial [Mesorhabditis belari]|uniref:MPN domain-containing protein n=1 Tax=Mesorhabditis belari TaxID=2138241 RepID=A0AAF3EFU5_9BILA
MDALLRQLMMPRLRVNGISGKPTDRLNHPDTAETVHIGSLPLLKMLKHARSGVPLEVMGLMLGTFVDDYTINVVDVFAMPQSGTSVSVESVDPAYQAKMMDMLQRTGREEMVVGWYHSHPGFGCWLSDTDVNTQKSFEALHPRTVAVVVDPIQSVKGKVVLEAFRLMEPILALTNSVAPTGEPRQTTTNLGNLDKGSLVAQIKGLGFKYYDLAVNYPTTEKEQKMLLTLHQHSWRDGLAIKDYDKCSKGNGESLAEMIKLVGHFAKDVTDGVVVQKKEKGEKGRKKYGKLNAKQRLKMTSTRLMEDNIVQETAGMINTAAFH